MQSPHIIDALGHAPEEVVAQARDLVACARLRRDKASRVVGVAPAALVGVRVGDLVAADVVG